LYWERQAGRRAILFGSEKRGLCNADLAFCNAVVRIPTTTALPSMNLGQAVAVCCYELRRRATAVAPQVARASATADELQRVLQAWRSLLGEPDSKHGAVRARRLERTLRRLNLSSKDAVFLLCIARDVGWRLNLGGVKGDG